jgi:hypothetical protein
MWQVVGEYFWNMFCNKCKIKEGIHASDGPSVVSLVCSWCMHPAEEEKSGLDFGWVNKTEQN